MVWDNQELVQVSTNFSQTYVDSSNGCCAESPTLKISPQETFVRLYGKGKPNMLAEEAHFRTHRVALALNKLNKTRTEAGF
jgi:hypothetical protein